jgi:geranylgeranyl reductase family protein
MENCDVLVVGGGPAGSTIAGALRRGGLHAVILDVSSFPREKVCAGWITPAVVDLLDIEDEYSRGHVFQPITGFKTSMMGGSEVVTRYAHTISYGIRRSEFDYYLLTRAGARLRLGDGLTSLRREHGYWIVNDNIKTPLLIGAGGHFCPVSRFMRKGREQNEAVVIAQEVEFPMDESQQRECQVRGDTPELFFCEDLKGYGWCFRKENYLNIGLGREDSRNFNGHVKAFCGYLRDKKNITLNSRYSFRGHAYRLYKGASQTLVADGVLLVGDAAGLAYPKSGEGIRTAIESALLAAEVIRAAAGDYRHAKLAHYLFLLAGRFGNASSPPGMVRQTVRRLAGRRLMATSWFSRHILLDRWFLNVHQPSLNNYLSSLKIPTARS